MNKQFEDLLKLYKDYIVIFNNWANNRDTTKDYDYKRLVRIYLELTYLLLDNNIIEKNGIKNFRVVESGEII